jgi:hypothetical protein
LKEVTLDTDTTVQTVYGRQMGARKGYNPQHRGKKSWQPILTFLAETREYVSGELRKGDRPTGKQIAAHLEGVFAALPESVERVYARADSGFYCGEAVAASSDSELRRRIFGQAAGAKRFALSLAKSACKSLWVKVQLKGDAVRS